MIYRINDNGTDRDMTAAEIAAYEAAAAPIEAHAAAVAAAADAKAAALESARNKLATLGLTPEEIAAFLG
jgi:hypothetical protein